VFREGRNDGAPCALGDASSDVRCERAADVELSRSDGVSECAGGVVPECSGLLRASQIHGGGMACWAELLPPRPIG
jgi:hypothetical protein